MPESERDFEPAEQVIVTALDGEQHLAVVEEMLDAEAQDHVLFEEDEDVEDVTVHDYWGASIEPDEAVVRVRYAYEADDDLNRPVMGPKSYDFPASRVQRRETTEEDE